MSNFPAEVVGRWHKKLAVLLAESDSSRVPELLFDAVRELIDFDSGQMCVMGESIRPIDIYDDVPDEIHDANIKTYYDGAYLLDPYYLAGVSKIEPGLYRLRDIAPPGFRQSQYYRIYYRDSYMTDEVVSLTYVPDNLFIHTSYVRHHGSPNFREPHLDRIRRVQPLIDQILQDFWHDYRTHKSSAVTSLGSELAMALDLFGTSLLTARECEIIQHHLKGHNTRSISERLNISQHTVSMHRKNAYAKLDIRSQFELFHLFIDSIDCFDASKREDPLTEYLGISRKG